MLTFICQVGMKSALCRTLSKILCSWGLMKELSDEKIVRSFQISLPRNPVTVRTTLCSDAVATVRTLNAEHLSYLECSTADLAQCVDYSLSISL